MAARKERLIQMARNKAVFLVFLLLVFLLTGEACIRLLYPWVKNYDTEMWRYCRELKRNSSSGVPFEHIPGRRIELYNTEIKTNSLGMRAERDYSIPKPEHTKRILVLGDSTTFGWGVDFRDTYPYLLEKLLNEDSSVRYEVINAGVGNYNSSAELEALKKMISLDPDIIILGYYINDPEEISFPSLLFLKKHSYLYAFLWSKLINMRCSSGQVSYKIYYSNLYKNKSCLLRAKSDIIQMSDIARQRSIPFVLVNIPEMHDFKEYYFQPAQQFVRRIASQQPGIIFLDLLDFVKGEDAEKFWVSEDDPHPNALFYRIAAEAIYSKLKTSGMLLN